MYYSRMTNATNLKWTQGNEKLNKGNGGVYRILGYGIPADFDFDGGNTCPGASACRAVCYAKQGRYIMPNVRDARMHNLAYFLKYGRAEFVLMAEQDLTRFVKRYNVVRIHDSGDFFSQDYVDAWKDIASLFPQTIFYAYTKSHHLDFVTDCPANLRIVQSLGGKHDAKVNLSRSHARIFASDAARERAGYVDGNVNDLPAIDGAICIGLVYHGVRKLTDAQRDFFG